MNKNGYFVEGARPRIFPKGKLNKIKGRFVHIVAGWGTSCRGQLTDGTRTFRNNHGPEGRSRAPGRAKRRPSSSGSTRAAGKAAQTRAPGSNARRSGRTPPPGGERILHRTQPRGTRENGKGAALGVEAGEVPRAPTAAPAAGNRATRGRRGTHRNPHFGGGTSHEGSAKGHARRKTPRQAGAKKTPHRAF